MLTPAVIMDGFSQVFIFTDTAPDVLGKSRGDMAIFALLFASSIVLLALFNRIRNPAIRLLLGQLAVGGLLIGGLFSVIVLVVYLNTLADFRALQNAYAVRLYSVAEGVVSVSHVQPPGCDVTGDQIQVDGVEFEINYCHGAPFGYNRTIKNNGVLTDGAEVRVYYTDGKTILRVDVKQ